MLEQIKLKIKENAKLKSLLLWLISAPNSARPRIWVRLFLNPLLHKRGKGSKVRFSVRKDLFPFNQFVLGEHSFVEDFTTLNNGVGDLLIGHHTRVGIGCTVIAPVSIGHHVHLAQNIVISGLNHNYEDIHVTIHDQGVSKAPVIIEDDVWIGANSVITSGVTIGKHSVVAAGSVVTKSIPPFSVWAGTPAKPIKQYNHQLRCWERIK
jgi:Acetyltransferase (isoleucine patch superfamily)